MIAGLTPKDHTIIFSIFQKHPCIIGVWVFGSRALGNFKPGSDVDLALKGAVDDATRSQVSMALNEETYLPYIFDVVVYDHIESAALKEHIDQCGKRIYSSGS